jgi:hypothetical protein
MISLPFFADFGIFSFPLRTFYPSHTQVSLIVTPGERRRQGFENGSGPCVAGIRLEGIPRRLPDLRDSCGCDCVLTAGVGRITVGS